jgi:hypothetical protein
MSCLVWQTINLIRGCRGRDSMVVGFTTTCAISASNVVKRDPNPPILINYLQRQFIFKLKGRDHTDVGFITTYAINAYHHWWCEFESRSGRGAQHYVIKFVSDLRQGGGFLCVLWFPPPIKLTATIVEILLKGALNNIILPPPRDQWMKFKTISWKLIAQNMFFYIHPETLAL